MAEDELVNLFQKLKAKREFSNIDGEWLELYEFQRKLRFDRNITASDILASLNLPLSLLQFMYSIQSIPRKKVGTWGSKLRSGLADLREAHTNIECADIPSNLVREFFENKSIVLRKYEIDSLHVSNDGDLVVGTPSRRQSLQKVTNILRELNADKRILSLPIRVEIYLE